MFSSLPWLFRQGRVHFVSKPLQRRYKHRVSSICPWIWPLCFKSSISLQFFFFFCAPLWVWGWMGLFFDDLFMVASVSASCDSLRPQVECLTGTTLANISITDFVRMCLRAVPFILLSDFEVLCWMKTKIKFNHCWRLILLHALLGHDFYDNWRTTESCNHAEPNTNSKHVVLASTL